MYTKMADHCLFFPSDNLFFPVLFFMLKSTYYSQNYASIIRQGLVSIAMAMLHWYWVLRTSFYNGFLWRHVKEEVLLNEIETVATANEEGRDDQ